MNEQMLQSASEEIEREEGSGACLGIATAFIFETLAAGRKLKG
jgi:hypothetical protein